MQAITHLKDSLEPDLISEAQYIVSLSNKKGGRESSTALFSPYNERGWVKAHHDWKQPNNFALACLGCAVSHTDCLPTLQDFGAVLPPKVVAPGTPIGNVTPEAAQEFGLSSDCLVVAGTTGELASLF